MYEYETRYYSYYRAIVYFIIYSIILFWTTGITFLSIRSIFYLPIGFALSGAVAAMLMFIQYRIEKNLSPIFWIFNILIEIFGYYLFTKALFNMFYIV
jgi:hypothetical protein